MPAPTDEPLVATVASEKQRIAAGLDQMWASIARQDESIARLGQLISALEAALRDGAPPAKPAAPPSKARRLHVIAGEADVGEPGVASAA
jgi:hypothetical protein